MAAVSDRASFYIEQTVPELQEWLHKEIFSKSEITQITSRRTRFEHIVNSREATPSVYSRYASYEMNLESLRKKRVKRMGVKMPMHTGQRRIYYILDRATKKFHGDLGLWMLYVEYARKCGAHRKTAELLTKMLRLHPGKPELWIYAANWALDEEGDVDAARGYLQRGLRFCERAKQLWIEYAKLEMIYIAKIVGRRRILGLGGRQTSTLEEPPVDGAGVALDADTITLPSVTAADLQPVSEDEALSQQLDDQLGMSPVLAGAIPMSIFDAAMQKFQRDEALAVRFFDMFAEFETLPCLQQILQHVLIVLRSEKLPSLSAFFCLLRMPLVGLVTSDPRFPAALGQALAKMNEALAEKVYPSSSLAEHALGLLLPFSITEALDDGLQRVLAACIRRCVKLLDGPQAAGIVEGLRAQKHRAEADALLRLSLKHFGPFTELEALQAPSKDLVVAVEKQ